ncbi:MAG: 1 protein [Patescibacteria group bacterium]|nr:1 protein [Patescibacteria group bacterium]
MAVDKYSAVWVSHSSMGDFLNCPRLYFLHNVYKDPKTKRKINLVNPALALGQAVHNVVEGLANFKAEERFERDLLQTFEEEWKKVEGVKGGFKTKEEEEEVKLRGKAMIERVVNNPGPLKEKTVKLKESENGMPPNFYLSEEDNIILCGKIDWLKYVPEDDSIHVLDFKTGRHDEKEGSLQLPIYALLLNKLQKRKVSGASYWYLDRNDVPEEVSLPNLNDAHSKVLETAKKVAQARAKGEFLCPKGGCFACTPYEKILSGEATYIGKGEYNQDMFFV